jgi:hypothetical protein
MAKIKKSYDCLIFGGGLSGLLAAKILSKKNKSFLIVEPSEKLGGRLSGWNANEQVLSSNLNLYSQTEKNLEHFNWLEKTIDKNIISGSFQTSTLHFQDGGFKSFNGFGDRSPEALDQLNKFCFENEKIEIQSYPKDWINSLVAELSEDDFITHSEITKLNFTEGSESAVSAEINGKTTVEFTNLIWAVAPQKLLETVDAEKIGAPEAKKLKKQSGVFDAVILNLAHQDHDFQNIDLSSVFCFYGSNQEFEPIIGTVSKNQSCWMTLIESEKTLDHEYMSKAIKNMKKQIKRAFPDLLDSKDLKEKIIVSESSYGQLALKESETGFLKSIPNLFCASSLCSETESGLIGTLDRSQKLDASI